MDLQLAGKTALVTGSTGGIGFAVADALAGEGANVILNGRTPVRVDAAVDRLRSAHPDAEVRGIPADFAEPEQVRRLIDALPDPVDVLVNNVGLFEVMDFADIDDERWTRYFEVNVMSGVRLSRAMLPRMLARGWGRVIFVNSESAVNVPAQMTHYGTTKAASLALANGLAKLTRGTAVTVNTVLGGPTYSDGVAAVVERLAEQSGTSIDEMTTAIAATNRTSLVERFLDPGEIARLVAYLASPVSSATNGSALRADGGTLTAIL